MPDFTDTHSQGTETWKGSTPNASVVAYNPVEVHVASLTDAAPKQAPAPRLEETTSSRTPAAPIAADPPQHPAR